LSDFKNILTTPWFLFNSPPILRIMLEAEVPPERVKEKFEEWDERYSVEKLEELSLSDLRSEKASFDAEVIIYRTEYNPGRLVTPAMAAAAGKEPLTQDQFEEVRRLINEKAKEIQMNFKRAKGRRRDKEEEQRKDFWGEVTDGLDVSLVGFSPSIELPKLR